jgi:hypothetical protein
LGGADYYLFRLPDGKWYIQSRAENLNVSGNDVVPIDRDQFETAVRKSL